MQPVILTGQPGARVKQGLEGGDREQGERQETKGISQVRDGSRTQQIRDGGQARL